MNVRLLRSASQDIVDAFKFYERQEEGLGTYFVQAIFSELDLLAERGGIHPKVLEGFHRVLTRRFPFGIFYRVEGDLVLVYGVIDCRRDPDEITRKLQR